MSPRDLPLRGDAHATLPVFERLAPRPDPREVTARIDAASGTGDVIFDLHGRGGWVARVAVGRQRRAVTVESMPLTRLLADVVLRPPDIRHLDAAFQAIAAAPRGQSSLRMSLSELFATRCATCGRSRRRGGVRVGGGRRRGSAPHPQGVPVPDVQGPAGRSGAAPGAHRRGGRRARGAPRGRIARAGAAPTSTVRREIRDRFPLLDGREELADELAALQTPRQLVYLHAILAAHRDRPPGAAGRGCAPARPRSRPSCPRAGSRARRAGPRRSGSPARTCKVPAAGEWRERNPWVAFEDGYRSVRAFVQGLDADPLGSVQARTSEDLLSLGEGMTTAVVRLGSPAGFRGLADDAPAVRSTDLRPADPAGPRAAAAPVEPGSAVARLLPLRVGPRPRRRRVAAPRAALRRADAARAGRGSRGLLRRSLAAAAPLARRRCPRRSSSSRAERRGARRGRARRRRRGLPARRGASPRARATTAPAGSSCRRPARRSSRRAHPREPRAPAASRAAPGSPMPSSRRGVVRRAGAHRARPVLRVRGGAHRDRHGRRGPPGARRARARGPPARRDPPRPRPHRPAAALRVRRAGDRDRRRAGAPPPSRRSRRRRRSRATRRGAGRRRRPAAAGPGVRTPARSRPAPRAAAAERGAGADRDAVMERRVPPVGRRTPRAAPTASRRCSASSATSSSAPATAGSWRSSPAAGGCDAADDQDACALPLSDRVEWAVFSLLATASRVSEAAFRERDRRACSPGRDEPDEVLRPRLPRELPRAREHAGRAPPVRGPRGAAPRSTRASSATLVDLGHRLGMRVWIGRREQSRRLGGRQLAEWLDERELGAYLPLIGRGPDRGPRAGGRHLVRPPAGDLPLRGRVDGHARRDRSSGATRGSRRPTRSSASSSSRPSGPSCCARSSTRSPLLRAGDGGGQLARPEVGPPPRARGRARPSLEDLEPYLGLDPAVEHGGGADAALRVESPARSRSAMDRTM